MNTWQRISSAAVVCGTISLDIGLASGAIGTSGTYKSPNGTWTYRDFAGATPDTGKQSATLVVSGKSITGTGNDNDGCKDNYSMTLKNTATVNKYTVAGSFVENCGGGDVTTYKVTNGTFIYKKTNTNKFKLNGTIKTKGISGTATGGLLTETFNGTRQTS